MYPNMVPGLDLPWALSRLQGPRPTAGAGLGPGPAPCQVCGLDCVHMCINELMYAFQCCTLLIRREGPFLRSYDEVSCPSYEVTTELGVLSYHEVRCPAYEVTTKIGVPKG